MSDGLECGIWDKKGVCLVPIVQLEALPLYHRKTIPSDYLDVMGHMNIRWYMALYDRAGWKFFSAHGLDQEYYREQQAGVFAFKHFIQYFAEVRVGQKVALRTRLLGRSEKRFHFIHFMINETTGQLASTLEGLVVHVDLKIRRAAPITPYIVEKLNATLEADQQLDWEPPLCGVIKT
jgi:acyl-CoA thioester hydrolase